MLCEKAGLVQRALEHYESIDDKKRVLMRTELMQPEFVVKFFGTSSGHTTPRTRGLRHPPRLRCQS